MFIIKFTNIHTVVHRKMMMLNCKQRPSSVQQKPVKKQTMWSFFRARKEQLINIFRLTLRSEFIIFIKIVCQRNKEKRYECQRRRVNVDVRSVQLLLLLFFMPEVHIEQSQYIII